MKKKVKIDGEVEVKCVRGWDRSGRDFFEVRDGALEFEESGHDGCGYGWGNEGSTVEISEVGGEVHPLIVVNASSVYVFGSGLPN